VRVDWGTVPAWVGAIGSLLVAAVIGGGLLYEIRLRRVADVRAAAERYDAMAAQARLVSVGGGIAKGRGGRISIRNDGDGPIRNLSYVVLARTPDGQVERLAVNPVKQHPPFVGGHADLRVDIKTSRLVDPRQTRVEVEFTDTNGLRWALTSDNELRQVHYEPEEGGGAAGVS
jgi:hypothetical protein